jgi:aspartokinase/homoserine dehydrogenase 1
LIGVPGVAKRLFGTLEELGVNVIMISQASSEHSITFVTLESQAEIAKAGIEEEFHRELKANRISNVDIQAPVSVIGAVGDGMHAMAGVSGRFFSALG